MRETLKQINCGRQNSTLENQGTRLDSAHLYFGAVRMAA